MLLVNCSVIGLIITWFNCSTGKAWVCLLLLDVHTYHLSPHQFSWQWSSTACPLQYTNSTAITAAAGTMADWRILEVISSCLYALDWLCPLSPTASPFIHVPTQRPRYFWHFKRPYLQSVKTITKKQGTFYLVSTRSISGELSCSLAIAKAYSILYVLESHLKIDTSCK